MKLLIVSFVLLIFGAGCALRPPVENNGNPDPKPRKSIVRKGQPKKNTHSKKSVSSKSQAFWRLVALEELTIMVKRLDKNQQTLSLPLTNDLSFHFLPSGDWEIVGFKLADKTYNSMNTSQKMIFKVRKKTFTYAGALIVQCPKVGQDHFTELKNMKFFNRYSYSSDAGLCEMVVGNDYHQVQESWKKIAHPKNARLSLGL